MARGAVIPAKAWVAQILLDRAFERSLAGHRPVKPWRWADTAPVARITLPRLGVSEVVLSGGSGQAMAFGPTLLPGKPPVTIMAAHRDTHFAFLKRARPGDVVEVRSITGAINRYRITGATIARWDRFAYPANPPARYWRSPPAIPSMRSNGDRSAISSGQSGRSRTMSPPPPRRWMDDAGRGPAPRLAIVAMRSSGIPAPGLAPGCTRCGRGAEASCALPVMTAA